MAKIHVIAIAILYLLSQQFHLSVCQCIAGGSEQSISGWKLRRHIYKTMKAKLGHECVFVCRQEDRCQSFNFVISVGMCEFNNRTKEARPEDFVPDPDRYYYRRAIKRVPLGSVPELPAESCKEIKASEGHVVSGKYWMSTIKPGMPVLAHCDMKTEDIDECTASSSVCDVNAICNNTLWSYECKCKAGYSGDGKTCRDIDECIASPVCDVNAICNNILGSYECKCKAGYSGDGKTCRDINECIASPVCDFNAICENSRGSYDCKCKPGYSGDGKTCRVVHRNCADIYKSGNNASGVHIINPDGLGEFEALCDQSTAGGGWTVFQKRFDGSVNFYRVWDDYKRGFGNLNGEFWLGLDKIHRLNASSSNKLRVDLEDVPGSTKFAEYSSFAVGNETEKYKLSLGNHLGTAPDSLGYHRGYPFTTKDRDNDRRSSTNCASQFKGAWWYYSCYNSNLNGLYLPGNDTNEGMVWGGSQGKPWHYSFKRSEMKIRPQDF